MPGTLVLLTLWIGAIAALIHADRAEKYLWIPVLLALAGVFSAVLPLAIAPGAAFVASGSILILFIFSLEVLPKATAYHHLPHSTQ